MAGAGRDRVARDFRFDTMMARYESLYEELLAKLHLKPSMLGGRM
jgi:hypothetical protein